MTSRQRRIARPLMSAVALTAVLVSAATRADAPKQQFDLSACGIARDTKTGLFWRRDFKCNLVYDDPSHGRPQEAVGYCKSLGASWRLPTLVELYSIVDSARQAPAIDPFVFPNTPYPSDFLSSDLNAPNSHLSVQFKDGSGSGDFFVDETCVRCVSTKP